MTKRLAAALSANSHLRSERVLVQDDGKPLTFKVVRNWMKTAQRRAGIRDTGNMHVLRHTFCSHLAMMGAPAISIQKLAGHEQISTTDKYLHLAKGVAEEAIRLLEGDEVPSFGGGEILEEVVGHEKTP